MPTNAYRTADAILAKLDLTTMPTVREIQTRLSKGQQEHLEPALRLLTLQGDVEIVPPPPGRVKPGRRIRLLRPIAPKPHCPSCTCYDVL